MPSPWFTILLPASLVGGLYLINANLDLPVWLMWALLIFGGWLIYTDFLYEGKQYRVNFGLTLAFTGLWTVSMPISVLLLFFAVILVVNQWYWTGSAATLLWLVVSGILSAAVVLIAWAFGLLAILILGTPLALLQREYRL